MNKPIKSIINKSESFDLLEIRVGEIVEVQRIPDMKRQSYLLKINFGKYGIKRSVGRFTMHSKEELMGQQVFGVLNFPSVNIAGIESEVLILGCQFPKAESGEATIISPVIKVKVGGKLF